MTSAGLKGTAALTSRKRWLNSDRFHKQKLRLHFEPFSHPVSWSECKDSPSWRVWGWAGRVSLVETGSLLVESSSYCWRWGQTWCWSWRPVKGKRTSDQISQSAECCVAMVTTPKKCHVMALMPPHIELCDRRQTTSDSAVRCQSPGQRCSLDKCKKINYSDSKHFHKLNSLTYLLFTLRRWFTVITTCSFQLTDTSCSLFSLKICIFIVTETFMLAVKHPLGVFTLGMTALVHLHNRVRYRRWRYACSWFVIHQYTLKRRSSSSSSSSSSSVMNPTLLLIGRTLEMSVLGEFWAAVLRCKHTSTSSGSLQFFSLLGRQAGCGWIVNFARVRYTNVYCNRTNWTLGWVNLGPLMWKHLYLFWAIFSFSFDFLVHE